MMDAALNNKSKRKLRSKRGAMSRLTIIPARNVSVSIADRQKIDILAQTISREDRNLSSTAYFGDGVNAGLTSGRAILIGDKSEIRLLAPAGQDTLEYRIAILQQADDLLVIASERNIAFEDYISDVLGERAPKVLHIPEAMNEVPKPTAVRCAEDLILFKQLKRHVAENKGTTIIPYISTGSIWALAKKLNEATGHPINVAGPPPNLAHKVNDKLWLADVAKRLFGEKSIPPTRAAHGLAALTGYVHRFAQKWDTLVIKVPDSAGSMGNFPIKTKTLKSLGAKALRDELAARLPPSMSANDYPLMVEVWDSNITASPSVQIWILTLDEGSPVIEGVFDQILFGEQGTFAGASPSSLTDRQDTLLCNEAMQFALLFQKLGYFGRCSFDAVIAHNENGKEQLHWIECNGRWGGVSLPMTFINRLFMGREKPKYIVVQLSGLDFEGITFDDALKKVGKELYDPNKQNEGVIFTTPGSIENGTGLHMISIGQTLERAKLIARRVQETLIG